jgi:hypothetical protein
MGTLNLAMPPSTVPGLPPGLSRRLLRRLIVGHGLGVGSRVLVAGRDTAALVGFLGRLGLIAHASESPPAPESSSIDAAATGDSVAEPDPVLWEETGWDLVLGLDLSAYEGSLYSAAAMHATAELLSCARPGGHALLLVQSRERGFAHSGHAASCFLRHLSHFPGSLLAGEFSNGLVPVDPLAWIVGRRPRPGCLLAGLRLPDDPRSRFDWHDQAEHGIRPENCCRVNAVAHRRSAA